MDIKLIKKLSRNSIKNISIKLITRVIKSKKVYSRKGKNKFRGKLWDN